MENRVGGSNATGQTEVTPVTGRELGCTDGPNIDLQGLHSKGWGYIRAGGT